MQKMQTSMQLALTKALRNPKTANSFARQEVNEGVDDFKEDHGKLKPAAAPKKVGK